MKLSILCADELINALMFVHYQSHNYSEPPLPTLHYDHVLMYVVSEYPSRASEC